MRVVNMSNQENKLKLLYVAHLVVISIVLMAAILAFALRNHAQNKEPVFKQNSQFSLPLDAKLLIYRYK